MNNSSTIFGSNVMGGKDKTPEEIIQDEEEQQKKAQLIQEDSLLQALSPINFDEKIMGGQQSKNFLHGKLPTMDDSFSYTDKVNKLTGKGIMTGAGIDEIFKNTTKFTMPKLDLGTNKDLTQTIKSKKEKTNKINDMFKIQQQNNPFTNNTFKQKQREVFSMKPINPFKQYKEQQSTNKNNQTLGFMNTQTNKDINNLIYGTKNKIKQINTTNSELALNKINQALGIGMQNATKNNDINNIIYGSNPTPKIKKINETNKDLALNKITQSFGVLNNVVGSQKINQILNSTPNPEVQTRQMLGLPYSQVQTSYDPVSRILGKPRQDIYSKNFLDNTPSEDLQKIPQGLNMIKQQFPNVTTKQDEDYIENSLKMLNNRLQDPDVKATEKERIAKTIAELKRMQRLEQEAKQKGNTQEEQRIRALAEAEIKANLARYEIDKRIESTEKQLEYQKERDRMQDEREREKLRAGTDIERRKLALQQQKGDVQLMEGKLRAGTNLVETLTSGGGRNILTPETLTGGTSDRQAYNIAMMSGGIGQGPGFQSKVMDSVGAVQTSKPFAQRVQETISEKKPEEVIQQERAQQETMQEQPRQVYREPQPQYRPQPQYPEYARPREEPQYEVDWEKMTPEEAARYDPEYAKYLEETGNKVTYRRGPYKK